jgi:hypothetical protein
MVKSALRVALLILVLTVAGCHTAADTTSATQYMKLRVTNYRGELVADWIAEGPVQKTDNGYRIKAIERTSPPPGAETTRYPNGWNTFVNGPHIVRWPCGKPLWLYQLDGY